LGKFPFTQNYYQAKHLKNGLEVIVSLWITIRGHIKNIYYRVGSRNEVMGKSGICHMLEHMSFNLPRNMEAGELD